MAIINSRDYYPFYQLDQYVKAPDELVVQMRQWKRDEKAYLRKRNRQAELCCVCAIHRCILSQSHIDI